MDQFYSSQRSPRVIQEFSLQKGYHLIFVFVDNLCFQLQYITFSYDDLKTLLFEYVQCLILGLTFRRDILNNSSYLTSMSQSVLQRSLFLELIIT